MRILAVTGPDDDGRSTAIRAAIDAFNRGLDIRLRFLLLGIEESPLDLSAPAPEAPPEDGLAAVADAITAAGPDIVLLHGRGPVVLAAAVSATKAGRRVARTGAGRRDGPHGTTERAIDRLADLLLPADAAGRERIAAEGLADRLGPSEDPPGEDTIRALLRLGRDATA